MLTEIGFNQAKMPTTTLISELAWKASASGGLEARVS